MSAARLARRAAVAALLCLLACAPTYHKPARWRHHPGNADRARSDAWDRCAQRGFPAGKPTRPFATDGCSMFPDHAWQACCVVHDMDYWCGGSDQERAASDREFRQCVAARFSDWRGPALASAMHLGVRGGGLWWLPVGFRWGFGHEYPKGRVP